MTLDKYKESRGVSYETISKKCKVSAHTLRRIARGYRLNRYDVALRISKACDGVVTVKELCE